MDGSSGSTGCPPTIYLSAKVLEVTGPYRNPIEMRDRDVRISRPAPVAVVQGDPITGPEDPVMRPR